MKRSATTTLLALHGFTQNGASFGAHLEPLVQGLPALSLHCPDAPHACPPASVTRMHGEQPPPPPYRCWWNATDDGQHYRGWEVTRDWLERELPRIPPYGLLGFSQGAILASTLTALAAAGHLPRPRFVVLVAGRLPRAPDVRALVGQRIDIPSLHVWGERDPLSGPACQTLAERFDPAFREELVWPGPHVVPTRGPAAQRIHAFMARHMAGAANTSTI